MSWLSSFFISGPDINRLLYFFAFIFSLFLMFFLNYINWVYTDDLFVYNFEKIKKKNKLKKLVFIIKNSSSFLVTNCFLQTTLTLFYCSFFDILVAGISKSIIISIIFSFFTSCFTEIFSRFVALKTRKSVVLNDFVLWVTYWIVRAGSAFFSFFNIAPKHKVTSYSEQDIIRYIKNMTLDNIVEVKEAQLVQAAFNFDDLVIENIMVSNPKIVWLNEKMKFSEIKKICLKNFFSYYPVLNNQGQVCGVFGFKKYYLNGAIESSWQDAIDRNFLCFQIDQTLDNLLDVLNNDFLTMAVIKKKDKFVGIITCKDVFNALLGKIKTTGKDPKEINKIIPELVSEEKIKKPSTKL